MKIAAIRKHRRYNIILIGSTLLIYIIVFTIIYFNKGWSEINREKSIGIKDVVAQKLNKKVNKLTSDDYKKIEKILKENPDVEAYSPRIKLSWQ